MQRLKVNCHSCQREIVLPASEAVIDDLDLTYRFTCPTCRRPQERMLGAANRSILRGAGVRTIDEMVDGWRAMLEDDEYVHYELTRSR